MTTDIAPTCTQEGTESIHCAVCDISKPDSSQSIPVTEHSWDAGKITKKPTYTATGLKTFTCTTCGKVKTAAVAKLARKANTLTVKAKKKVTIKYKKLKKKARKIKRSKAFTVSKANGSVTYKLVSVNKSKYKKYFKVNKKNGKITVKKKLKRGTYKVKIKVTAAGNSSHKKGTKTVTVKIRVK